MSFKPLIANLERKICRVHSNTARLQKINHLTDGRTGGKETRSHFRFRRKFFSKFRDSSSQIPERMNPSSSVRRASHAGSWYTADGRQLRAELDNWLRKADQGGKVEILKGQKIVYILCTVVTNCMDAGTENRM